ncbi:hypothetical protein WR25_26802 [Diploscapter pachys]|uniref:Uncharacterized protein n=1 Tax=Diploscapter pachys TaxID=2018661 RepID=A0A2A2KKL0_9BILA|nr:hypothetical protein WR25_26802 [Diploscapter pachys]
MPPKRKTNPRMQCPTDPQAMTSQQYCVQPSNSHMIMGMQLQHSTPYLSQNGYYIHPASGPNGINIMNYSSMILKLQYPPQQIPTTPPVPQTFVQNQGCAALPSTSTASMPPANVSSGYMSNQRNYAQLPKQLLQRMGLI